LWDQQLQGRQMLKGKRPGQMIVETQAVFIANP
jgi:hypothetical protein